MYNIIYIDRPASIMYNNTGVFNMGTCFEKVQMRTINYAVPL